MSDRDLSGRATQGPPERIEPDAILEALTEFRLEHGELPELVLGRLLDIPLWKDFKQARLPAADIPQALREADPALRYLPQVELRKGDATRVVRIGGRVLSYHVLAPYPGWSVFQPEIEAALDAVFVKLQAPQVCRISFRYINLLRPDGHHIHGVQDTNIALRVGGNVITESLAVTYNRSDPDHTVAVKVATPDFVTGTAPPGYSLLCDIDVFTKPNDLITDYASAMRWIQTAHTLEKTEFFSILPEAISRRLTVTPKESHNV
jgi:uncharacterized protein (TIGR04255 family)